jgi:membrane peptidoglycan carboxypeptidase
MGLPPIYREKVRAGLRLEDSQGRVLYQTSTPHEVYPGYGAIPQLLVRTLLFAENRKILDESLPYRNPTVEWARFSRAVFDFGLNKIVPGHPVSGGSTVATQLEKMRHWPGGRTLSAGDKLRQMLSSSLRSYQNGPQNLASRKEIVADYINSLPLAATYEQGEVLGLMDGLRAWFGADPQRVNELLEMSDEAARMQGVEAERALAYRQAVTLLLAAKKPSGFLVENRDALTHRVMGYLTLLARDGVISTALRDAAKAAHVTFRENIRPDPQPVTAERKGIDAIRSALLGLTGAQSLYALDRYDLTVKTTLDGAATEAVAQTLESLTDPDGAAKAGIYGFRMLAPGEAPGMVYSFTLYERQRGVNVLRVQSDNYNEPLNINRGTKLELGSTAKLRTLATYLEIVTALHAKYAGKTPAELAAVQPAPEDVLSAWALEYLKTATDRSLPAMLEAAMNRKYSANPGEVFFTGGGAHTFVNFESSDNGRVMPVREALQHSVNLVFIRLMRDVVRYYIAQHPEPAAALEEGTPQRREYLQRFADAEGRQFLEQFYRKYKSDPGSALSKLLDTHILTPLRFAVMYRTVRPEDSLDEYLKAAAAHGVVFPPGKAEKFYDEFAPGKFNWNDLGYLAHVHPLELWAAGYLNHHPQAKFGEAVEASKQARQEAYLWLFKRKIKRGQDTRIRIVAERDAFEEIHRSWARLGFPFGELVPSYATAIGVSGDTPDALATLVGIILNDGVRYPSVRIQQLHFAAGTPFETVLDRKPEPGERVMAPEVASLLRNELIGVVERGTAVRARNAITLENGETVPIGGKTGTGDNRIEHFGARGSVLESKVRNRTAAFVFTIGDRFFGTLLVYADGPAAAGKKFTSTLAVQVFRDLAPHLRPLISRAPTASYASYNRPAAVK